MAQAARFVGLEIGADGSKSRKLVELAGVIVRNGAFSIAEPEIRRKQLKIRYSRLRAVGR